MIINGKEKGLNKNITISELLLELNINKDRIVVELNKEIITKEYYEKINLKDDDTIEVVSFVGGG